MNPDAALETGSEEAGREALVRVLAGESRNALARVELAASELARFETAPALRERISTIRLAVEEIDSLLGKIDLMSEPIVGKARDPIDLGAVVRAVCQRLRSSVQARGIELECSEIEDGIVVCLPRRALEALLFAFLRVGLASGEGRRARVQVDVFRHDAQARCVLRGDRGANALRAVELDRETRLELEVALAEWGGRLLAPEEARGCSLGFELPMESPHA